MLSLIRRFWADDRGAVVSTEYVMVSGLVVGGVGSGMVAIRNAGIKQANALADTISATPYVPTPAEMRSATAMPTHAAAAPQSQAQTVIVVNNITILPPSP